MFGAARIIALDRCERRIDVRVGNLYVGLNRFLGIVRIGELHLLLRGQQVCERRRVNRQRRVVLCPDDRRAADHQPREQPRRDSPQPTPYASKAPIIIASVLHNHFPLAGGLHLPSLTSRASRLKRRLALSISL